MVDSELPETASAGSSQTLVEDTPMTMSEENRTENTAPGPVNGPVDRPPSSVAGRTNEGEAKMSKLTVEELAAELDKPNVGSDQMDVDEVMGNAIDHLRAAFKVAQTARPDGAPDPINEAFFSTFIDNRKKIGESEWNRTSRSDRWVTAYPAQEGTRDLYDALANSFDLEPLPGDLLSFTTIEKPAPHFHICIQRADGVRKNSNPITIPDMLYLDRFMHTSDPQSSISKSRKRGWDIKTRLNELAVPAPSTANESSKGQTQGPKSSGQNEEFTEEEIDDFLVIGSTDAEGQDPSSSLMNDMTASKLDGDATVLDAELKELLSEYGIVEAAHPSPPTPEETKNSPKPKEEPNPKPAPQPPTTAAPLPPSDLTSFWEKFFAEETAERERLTGERDRIFSDRHDVAYRLHAVVCHAGTASAGHYWVWIHDFERDVWRKYNDTTVSVHPAEFVFSELNTKGEPYYLAYVRADQVKELVSVPRRKVRTPPPVPPRPRPAASDAVTAAASGGGGGGDGDTAMLDVDVDAVTAASAAVKAAMKAREMAVKEKIAAEEAEKEVEREAGQKTEKGVKVKDEIVVSVEQKEDVDMSPPPYSA